MPPIESVHLGSGIWNLDLLLRVFDWFDVFPGNCSCSALLDHVVKRVLEADLVTVHLDVVVRRRLGDLRGEEPTLTLANLGKSHIQPEEYSYDTIYQGYRVSKQNVLAGNGTTLHWACAARSARYSIFGAHPAH